jgi:O-antigen ligase
METFIQPLLIIIISITLILFFIKPEWVLFVFIASLPIEALIDDSIFTLPKILGFLAVLSFFVILIREKRKLHFDFPFFIMFLLVIWGSFTYFWSISPDTTLIRITTLLQLLILYFLMINQIRNVKNLDLLLKFLFIGSVIYSIFGLSDLIMIVSGNRTMRLASVAGNANWYFLVSICLIPACYWVFSASKTKIFKILAILVLLILLITSLYTQSRGGLISLGMFFFSILIFSRGKFSWLIVFILLALMSYQFIPEGYLGRFTNILDDLRITGLWPAGWRAFQDELLIGHGLGTNGYVITRYLGVNYLNYFDSVHNALLGIGIELGLIGLFLYILFILIPTSKLIHLLNTKDLATNSLIKNFSIYQVSVIMAYLISWIKGGGLEFQKMLWFLVGMEAILIIILQKEKDKNDRNSFHLSNDK